MISTNSLVMTACLVLLYVNVSLSIISPKTNTIRLTSARTIRNKRSLDLASNVLLLELLGIARIFSLVKLTSKFQKNMKLHYQTLHKLYKRFASDGLDFSLPLFKYPYGLVTHIVYITYRLAYIFYT